MKKLLVFLALLGMVVTPLFAQGPVTGPYLVDHYSNNFGTTVTYHAFLTNSAGVGAVEFTFTEPQILTATTTIPLSAITVITPPLPPCVMSGAVIHDPGTALFGIEVDFSGAGCISSEGILGLPGPATSSGVFGIPNVATLTIAVSAAPDQQVRLVNFGTNGTPLTSPTGDVCANIYVFDANQEMAACCSCRITPNGLKTLPVFTNLTNNPVTSIVPLNGDIKIVSTAAIGATPCTPLSFNGGLTDSLVGFGTHVNTTGIGSFISETQIPAAAFSSQEQNFLPQACQLTRYLGSGKGTCSCNVD